MATANVRAAMFQTTRDALKRKFDALYEQQNNTPNFHVAETAYLRCIGEDKIAGRLMKEIILEGRIFKPDLQALFNTFTINTASTKSEQRWFCFWDEELENKFHLKKEFLEMMTFSKKELQSLTKYGKANEDTGAENTLIAELDRSRPKKFFIIQQLHNDLMEKAEREIAIYKALSDSNYSESLEKDLHKKSLQPIKSIILVEATQTTKPLLIINSNYNDGITIKDFTSKDIKSLYDAIRDNRRKLQTDNPIRCRDYLNFNEKCAIYRSKDGHKQAYRCTNIVRTFDKNKTLEIVPEIIPDIISQTEYRKRLSKQLSSKRNN
jgi:hypothetical protein